jgi:hypothetical protein
LFLSNSKEDKAGVAAIATEPATKFLIAILLLDTLNRLLMRFKKLF